MPQSFTVKITIKGKSVNHHFYFFKKKVPKAQNDQHFLHELLLQ